MKEYMDAPYELMEKSLFQQIENIILIWIRLGSRPGNILINQDIFIPFLINLM